MTYSFIHPHLNGRAAFLMTIAVLCIAIGRVAEHAYVAASVAAFMITLGVTWPHFIVRFVCASSRLGESRCRVGSDSQLSIEVFSRWPLPLTGFEVGTPDEHFPIATTAVVLRRGRQHVSLAVLPRHRGIYPVHELTIGSASPFGLWRAHRTVLGSGRLIVWPVGERIDSSFLLGASRSLAVDQTDSRSGADGDLSGVRDYRRGDAMRSIHWRQTARHERLIVRERTRGERRGCVVCLDVRRRAYEEAATFERAISVTAGLIERATKDGIAVDLWIGGKRLSFGDEQGLSNAMDALAAVEWSVADDWPREAIRLHGLIVTTPKGRATMPRTNLTPYSVERVHP